MRRVLLRSPRFVVGVFGVALAGLPLVASCATTPPIVVHNSRVGQVSEPELGTTAVFQRITEPSQEGHAPGYFAIQGSNQWAVFFSDMPSHPLPRGIDFDRDTVVAAYAGDTTTLSLQVKRAIASSNGTHLYLTKEVPGEGCVTRRPHPAFDVVTIPRTDQPIHVHVDAERGEACTAQGAPVAHIACRPVGQPAWSPKITAGLGADVECEARVDSGDRPIVERSLVFSEIPPGSNSKISFAPGALRGTFTADAIGRFALRVEARDDKAGMGDAVARIEVPPPTNDTYAEIAWTGFVAVDELETFPRVELHASDARPLGDLRLVRGALTTVGAKRDCAYESTEKPPFCSVSRWGVTTISRLSATPPGKYDVSVKYVDDRFEKGPVLCVRIFTKGALTQQVCDPLARKAGALWEIGTLDEASGRFAATVPPAQR